VAGEQRGDVLIDSGRASVRDGHLAIESPRGGTGDISVRVPTDCDLSIGTVSGNVSVRGKLRDVRVTTVSGTVAVEQAERVDVRGVSSDIEVGRATRCLLRTKTGKAICGAASDAQVSTVSGRIRLPATTGVVEVQSVSGAIEVGTARAGRVRAQTLSGKATIAIPPGVRPRTRLASVTGRPRYEGEQGSDCDIAVRSVSGPIEVASGP
jgi:DUF4097 and DUF4098 domain-containing protein YvlB